MRRSSVVVLLLACSSKKEPPPAAGSGSGSATDAAVAISDARGSAKPAPPPPDPKVEAEHRKQYTEAMAKGREATDAKQYAEAIAAFDGALKAKPGDPKALAERGFARLLEGKNLDAASRDLDDASSTTKDKKLLSMIWFNRGLVEEKRGSADNARAAFWQANELRPTKAAQAKLAGQAACPVQVERKFQINPDYAQPLVAADWLVLAKAALPDEEPPDTIEGAWDLLTGEAKQPTLPAAAVASGAVTKVAYAVLGSGRGLRALPLAVVQGTMARCAGEVSAEVIASTPEHVHIRVVSMDEGGYTYMCKDKAGELVECSGAKGETDSGTACMGGTTVQSDLVVDVATGKVLLAATQPHDDDESKLVTVKQNGRSLSLTGRGCTRTEALP